MRLPVNLSCIVLSAILVSGFSVADDLRSEYVTTPPALAVATFAGGCFWCMQPPFDKLDGVHETIVGYTGGHVENPTYREVSIGGTGHLESVEVHYDPERVSYLELLRVFWTNIDPVDDRGQFCDKGDSYRSAIFYHNAQQRDLAKETLALLNDSKLFDKAIVTRILPAEEFYPAEGYHQNYYQKNPLRYKYYRYRCNRDARLDTLWKDVKLPF